MLFRSRNDSDENEIEHSDEDIWHDTEKNDDDDDDEYGEEPTFYDSRMWVGDCSFDHHNEADPIANDPINAPHIETEIYEPGQRSTQRSDVRTDWNVPSVGVTPQIRDVTGQRQTYTYASEALTYRTSGTTFPL